MTKDKTKCNCIKLINEALEREYPGQSLVVDASIPLRKGEQAMVAVSLVRLTNSKKRTPHLFANHCPFCGRKYLSAV